MKILICGSRNYPRADKVRRYVSRLPEGTQIIVGDAKGVDSWAYKVAKAKGIKVRRFKAFQDFLLFLLSCRDDPNRRIK